MEKPFKMNYQCALLGSGVFIGLLLLFGKNKRKCCSKEPEDIPKKNTIQDPQNKLYKICMTGGPCSGKTTGLIFLQEKLKERGFNVFVVPEAATLIAGGGGVTNIANFGADDIISFQISLLKLQTVLEDTFETIAMMSSNINSKSVVLCDRGLMDGKAYMPEELWQQMLVQYKLKEDSFLDRYNAVCHLVTAADGAEEYYNLYNDARHESPELAITVDRKTEQVWSKHPNFVKLDNYSVQGFQQKLYTLFNRVSSIVELPLQFSRSMRFLLDTGSQLMPEIPSYIKPEHFYIVDVFPDTQNINQNIQLLQKIQKRQMLDSQKKSKDSSYIYVFVEKTLENQIKKTNTRRKITYREYRVLIDRQDKQRLKRAVEKHRICFTYNDLYMTIDTYPNIKQGFSILKFHPNDSEQIFKTPPPFLKITRDVTNEPGYKTRQLAKTSWYVPEGDEKIINLRKLSNFEEEESPN